MPNFLHIKKHVRILIQIKDSRRTTSIVDHDKCGFRRVGGVNLIEDGSIMRTDSQLKRDVTAELAWDPAINSDAIGVAAQDGVVTITGHLDNFAEKFAIERALRRVQDVRAIALELDVKRSPRHRRNDTELALALAIGEALRCNTALLDKLRVTVKSVWVTLTGDVDWEYQRGATESVVRPLIGVVGVTNKISLRPRLPACTPARHGLGRTRARYGRYQGQHSQPVATSAHRRPTEARRFTDDFAGRSD